MMNDLLYIELAIIVEPVCSVSYYEHDTVMGHDAVDRH